MHAHAASITSIPCFRPSPTLPRLPVSPSPRLTWNFPDVAFRKVVSSGFTPGYLTQIRTSRFWYLLIPINLPLYRTKWQVRLERVVHYLYVRRFADMSTINRGGLKMGPPLLLTSWEFPLAWHGPWGHMNRIYRVISG